MGIVPSYIRYLTVSVLIDSCISYWLTNISRLLSKDHIQLPKWTVSNFSVRKLCMSSRSFSARLRNMTHRADQRYDVVTNLHNNVLCDQSPLRIGTLLSLLRRFAKINVANKLPFDRNLLSFDFKKRYSLKSQCHPECYGPLCFCFEELKFITFKTTSQSTITRSSWHRWKTMEADARHYIRHFEA